MLHSYTSFHNVHNIMWRSIYGYIEWHSVKYIAMENHGVVNPQSHSFSQSYGTSLPTSLNSFNLPTRGYQPWRPVADIDTIEDINISALEIFKNHLKLTKPHCPRF